MTGEDIRPDELIKGYEIAPNEFAVIDPQEIKAAEIETFDTIDLFHFVKASSVDPIYFERSYYVAPEPGSERATHCCWKQCGERNVSGLRESGCTDGEVTSLRIIRCSMRTKCAQPPSEPPTPAFSGLRTISLSLYSSTT